MYYKVVNRDLTSAIVSGDMMVQYAINEWVRAPEWLEALGFGPVVFDEITPALDYMRAQNLSGNLRVFECLVNGVRKPQLIRMNL